MKNKIYDFYLRRDEESPAYKLFRGTESDFKRVETLYEELWSMVIDKNPSADAVWDVSDDTLSDDPILLSWEGAGVEIVAEDSDTHEQYWYFGWQTPSIAGPSLRFSQKLQPIGTQVIAR